MKKILVTILTLVFILGIFGTAAAANLTPFTDVPAKHWSYAAITQLAKDGIIDGYGDGTFRGDRTISRYEMAILVARAMTKLDKADKANKVLIEKLESEYNTELVQIGALDARVTAVEKKVNDLDKIHFSGDVYTMLIGVNDAIQNPGANGSVWRSRILLNMTDKVDDATTVYLRFGERNLFGGDDSVTQPWATNTNAPYRVLDHYGFKYTNNGITYNMGRQDVSLGHGLLLSTGGDAQWNNQFDGLVASGKLGTVDTTVLVGKTTTAYDLGGDVPASWYGLDLKSKVGDNVSLGTTFVRHRFDPGVGYNLPTKGQNMWAVNTSITASPNFSINAEYAKSDFASDNKAYTFGGTYAMGKNDSLSATYVRVDGMSIDPYNSTFSAIGAFFNGQGLNNFATMRDWRGMEYYYNHKLTKSSFLDFYLVDAKTPGHSGHDIEEGLGWHVMF